MDRCMTGLMTGSIDRSISSSLVGWLERIDEPMNGCLEKE